jgi:hypothetical protein
VVMIIERRDRKLDGGFLRRAPEHAGIPVDQIVLDGGCQYGMKQSLLLPYRRVSGFGASTNHACHTRMVDGMMTTGNRHLGTARCDVAGLVTPAAIVLNSDTIVSSRRLHARDQDFQADGTPNADQSASPALRAHQLKRAHHPSRRS